MNNSSPSHSPSNRAKPLEEVNLKALFNKYFISKWYWYVLLTGLCIGAAYFYLQSIEPQYLIKGKVLIRESNDDAGATADMLKRTLNMSEASENVYNEIQVLTSHSLMKKVVKELQLDIQYYWQDWISKQDRYKKAPVMVDSYVLNEPGFYGMPFEIQVLDTTTFLFIADSLEEKGTFGEVLSNAYGSFSFSKKEGMEQAPEDTKLFIEFNDLDYLTELYLQRLQVRLALDNSTTLELILTDVSPERGVDVMGALIEGYNKLTIEDKNLSDRNALKFLDERIYKITQDLKSVEQRIENFQLNNNIASEANERLDLVLEDVSRLADEQKDLEVQLNILRAMRTQLDIDDADFELIPGNISVVGPGLNQIIEPYNKGVLEREQLLRSARETNPNVLLATKVLATQRRTIARTIDNLIQDLELKTEMIESQFAGSKEQLRKVPAQERGLEEIKRQRLIVENLYVYLLEKREETALSLIATASNFRLIDQPRPSKFPVTPKPRIVYLGALLAGLLVPFLILLIRQMFKDSVNTEEEVKELLPAYGVVGKINHSKIREKVVLNTGKANIVSENFRSLRTNLRFFYEAYPQVILVTSSVSGEGKSFVASNLALSFAMTKKKTIIVDFDMRRPVQKEYLNEDPDIGLSNYLVDAATPEAIIHKTKLSKYLDFISSGPIPPNPSELIMDSKMSVLFDYLKQHYDFIIFDAPPIGIVSDSILISKYATNSLYVIRAGYTKRRMLEDANEVFKQQKLIKPALVLNDIKLGKAYGYYYSGYSRYYRNYYKKQRKQKPLKI